MRKFKLLNLAVFFICFSSFAQVDKVGVHSIGNNKSVLVKKTFAELNTYSLFPKEQQQQLIDVLLYPNSIENILNVAISSNEKNISFTIVDLLGKVVCSGKESQSVFSIPMDGYKSGNYVIYFEVGNKRKGFKIIKK